LPNDFSSAQAALMGQGADGLKSSDGIYVSPASDYYNAQVNRQSDGIAGQKSVGQQLYDAASKRIDGIDALRKQIGQSEDPKTIADLQARIQTEIAAANTDGVRMQALAMVIRAEQRHPDPGHPHEALHRTDGRDPVAAKVVGDPRRGESRR
jgi:type IV secretion system protein VirB5